MKIFKKCRTADGDLLNKAINDNRSVISCPDIGHWFFLPDPETSIRLQ